MSPPPHGFYEVDRIEVLTSRRYDSEVESDILTYRPQPCQFRSLISQSQRFFCGSVGSLGSKRFLVDMEVLFSQKFSHGAHIRYHGVQDQDFSSSTKAQVIELLKEVGSQHAIGVHGQFDTRKSQDDLGFSYNLNGSSHWFRLEFNAFDYSRNHRNEAEDHFTRSPYSWTLAWLHQREPYKYYLNLHFETPYEWVDPSQAQTVKRTRQWVEAFVGNKKEFYFFESRQTLTHINSDYEDEKIWRVHGERPFGDLWRGGLRAVRKSWRANPGRLIQYDVLPFIWIHGPSRRLEGGYEVTWHRSYGHEQMKSQEDHSSRFEHRLNAGYFLINEKSGYFKLLLTFDLDRFGSGETWEGGSGQLAFTF